MFWTFGFERPNPNLWPSNYTMISLPCVAEEMSLAALEADHVRSQVLSLHVAQVKIVEHDRKYVWTLWHCLLWGLVWILLGTFFWCEYDQKFPNRVVTASFFGLRNGIQHIQGWCWLHLAAICWCRLRLRLNMASTIWRTPSQPLIPRLKNRWERILGRVHQTVCLLVPVLQMTRLMSQARHPRHQHLWHRLQGLNLMVLFL